MPDVESPHAAAAVPIARPPLARRRQYLFLLLGALSLMWLGAQIFVMHDYDVLHDGKDYNGADIDSVYGVLSAVGCRAACEEHPRCLAFTYVKTESACWLKGEGFETRSNPNAVSGAVNATLAAQRRGEPGAKSDEIDAQTGDFKDLTYDGAQGDGEPIGADDEGDGRNLENGAPYDMRYAEADGLADQVVSLTVEEQERYNDSTSVFGDVKLLFDVRAPDECERRCTGHGRCAAWTLHKYHALCMLRLLNTTALAFSGDFVSGRLSDAQISERAARIVEAYERRGQRKQRQEQWSGSGTEAGLYDGELADDDPWREDAGDPLRLFRGPRLRLPELSGVLDDTDLAGGDLTELGSVESIADCRAACAAHDASATSVASNASRAAPAAAGACHAWTLSKETSICWLKTANVTRTPVPKSRALVSGWL